MLRIGIDATLIGIAMQEKGGMYGTLYHLLRALGHIDETNEYILLVNFFRQRNLRALHELCKAFAARPNFTVRLSRVPNRLMQTMPMPINMFAGAVDVFHSPSHETYPVWGSRSIITIHDLRALTVDNSYTHEWANLLKDGMDEKGALLTQYRETVRHYEQSQRRLPQTIRRANLIITPSQFTKDAILGRFMLSEDAVRVIPWGISSCFAPVQDVGLIQQKARVYGIHGPFLLAVGRLDPQKNLLRLIEAFARLRRDTRLPHKLVIVGSRTWFAPILSQAIWRYDLGQEVLTVGHVPDADLPYLYSGAELLVFPSLFEGFGIPPLEAMACGCPVVASSATAIPEVVGDAALLVDPYSVDDIAEGMHAVLTHPQLRAALRARGAQRVKPFTWERAAQETLAAYMDRGNA